MNTSEVVATRLGVLIGGLLLTGTTCPAADLAVPAPPAAKSTSTGAGATPRVSADGRWIVFSSDAGNLVPADNNGVADVFLRDRQTGTTELVSHQDGSGASAGGSSLAPAMTPDGRYVVFQSTASNLVSSALVPPTTNAWRSLIYRFDRQTAEMRLINVNEPASGQIPAQTNVTRALVHPAISSDGQRVLFASGRQQFVALVSAPVPREPDALFVWDALSGETDHVTTDAFYSGQQFDERPLMSDDGRIVAFGNTTGNLWVGSQFLLLDHMNVIVRDRVAGTNFVPNWVHESASPWVSTYSRASGISADGQYLLYERRNYLVGDYGSSSAFFGDNLWLHHLPSGQFVCVSSNALTGLIGNGTSESGALSTDGNWAAYFSKASNLVADDTNGQADVFLYDRATASSLRISTHAAWQGVIGGRVEQSPKLTPDGRYVLYQAIGSGLFRYDRVAGTNALITTDVETDTPDISADGRFVVFTARPATIDASDPNPHRQVYCHDFVTGQTELISVRDPAVPVATPNGPSSLELAAVSATGRFIAFTSYADNLGDGASRMGRLWVRDTQLGTNLLVSVTPGGQPTSSTETFRNVQLSADGRWVSFATGDSNLVTGDANGQEDVFLRDLQLGTTRLVSRLPSGGGPPTARSHGPVISRSGSMVIFKHDGQELVTGGSTYDLYAHTVAGNTNRLATPVTDIGGGFGVSGPCEFPVLSADGRWLLFRTQAYNIYPESTAGGFYKLVLKDLTLQFGRHFVEAHRIDLDAQNQPLPGSQPGDWAFSADSQWLVFNHWDSTTSGVYRRPTANGPVELITTNGFRPLIANGGNIIAWQSQMPASGYTDTNATWDVFHHRVAEGVTRVISLDQSGGQTGNGASRLIALGPDGRYVLFRSHAANLVAGDANRSMDLFLRDTLSDTTVLLSRNLTGAGSGDSFSGKAVFTDDGSKVIFESYASDLVAGDFNLERDIFVAQLHLPDSDNDQLPDDWELTYFNTLDRDGTEDSDDDGHNDLAEFRAGTSPLNSASILQAIALTGIGSGTTTVMWSSVPGRTYQVQSRDDFSIPGWNNVGGPVTAAGASTSVPDPEPGDPDRFYRVVLVE